VPLIEGHNDLPSELLKWEDGDPIQADLLSRQAHLPADIPRLREGMVGAQFWAAFVDVDFIDTHAAMRQAIRQIDVILRMVEAYDDLEFARTADDIERVFAEGRIASLIGVEGGHAIESSLSALRIFHRLGVRYMTLCHNRTIDWVDSATDEPRHGGITAFGEEVVREMNRLGMFVDLSHVTAEAMKDVLRVTAAPVIFSHSSARAINSYPRNVPDEVLRMMPANGGVVMVNFYAGFVPPSGPAWLARQDSVRASLEVLNDESLIEEQMARWVEENPRPRGTLGDVADHIDHIRSVAGIDHVGIGADYYDKGGPSMAEGLDDLTRYPYLFAELLRRGYSDEDIRKIASGNLLRAMREMERVAEDAR
jgi:membrane dipeptidase